MTTPIEAQDMWCPIVYLVDMLSILVDEPWEIPQDCCKSHRCMMWRWVISAEKYKDMKNDLRQGYCGLAGKGE